MDELGARWSVWVGGLALALGAIFLVRYSIEAGFFGPGMRISFACLLGLAALAAGEWLRRSEPDDKPEMVREAYIPGVLTGVGILALFGAVYGSYQLYGFIGPTVAFGLMGLISAAGLLLGLRQGPAISGLGLAGSMVTPLLVSTTDPSYPGLYTYLAIISAGALALARYRGWDWLSLATVGGSIFWAALGLYLHGPDEFATWLIYLGAVFAIVILSHVVNLLPFASSEQTDVQKTLVPAFAYGGPAFLLLGMLHVDETSLRAFYACLAAGVIGIAVAWPWNRLSPLAVLAGVLGLVASVARGAVLSGGIFRWPIEGFYIATPLEGAWGLHVVLSAAFGLICLVSSVVWLKRHSEAPLVERTFRAVSGSLPPVLIILALWLLGARGVTQWEFAALFAVLVVLFALGAEWLMRNGDASENKASLLTDWPLNLIVLAAPISAVLGLIAGLSGLWLTLSLAALVVVIAAAFTQRPVWTLRLAAPGAGAVLALQTLDRLTLGAPVSETIILNELWLYLALPSAASAGAAWLLSRHVSDKWSQAMEALALAFAALFAVFQVRHFMNDGDLFAPVLTLEELSLQILVGLCFSLGLSRITDVGRLSLFSIAAMGAMGVSLFSLVVGAMLAENPMLESATIVKGGMFFNTLLLAYFAPGLLLGLIAWLQKERRPGWYIKTLGGISLAALITYLTTMVRLAYRGPEEMDVFIFPVGNTEQYTYSIIWLLFGIALLVGGLIFKIRELRIGSAAVMMLTVLKVFLIDMSELEGILRALSFVGLGAVLIGMGLVYQRVLTRDSEEAEEPPEAKEQTA